MNAFTGPELATRDRLINLSYTAVSWGRRGALETVMAT
jgi:hypothetical protein